MRASAWPSQRWGSTIPLPQVPLGTSRPVILDLLAADVATHKASRKEPIRQPDRNTRNYVK